MNRATLFVIWLASVMLAVMVGYLLRDLMDVASNSPNGNASVPRAQSDTADSALTGAADGTYADANADANADATSDARLALNEIRTLATAQRPFEAIKRARAALEDDPYHAGLLFELSALLETTGQSEAALEPLLTILQFPADVETAERARVRIDLLVTEFEQTLINAGDGASLVRYFERRVAAEPSYDGHRLKLARWLLRSGDVAGAERLLKEIGNVGVAAEEIELLTAELELTKSRLPIDRSEGALHTEVVVEGGRRTQTLRLVVDTGATMTGISVPRLKELGATRLEQPVTVHTASGSVQMFVYRVDQLSVGGLSLGPMDVLGLTELHGGADGLLGLDVLDQLPSSMANSIDGPEGLVPSARSR